MTCRDVERVLLLPARERPADLRGAAGEHARGCLPCAAALAAAERIEAALASLPDRPAVDAFEAVLMQEIRARPRPAPRPPARPPRAGWGALLVLASALGGEAAVLLAHAQPTLLAQLAPIAPFFEHLGAPAAGGLLAAALLLLGLARASAVAVARG
jgi:hypothetical protein